MNTLHLSESELAQAAASMMARCDQLAGISCDLPRLSRFYLTPEHRQANDLVGTWMKTAGLVVWEDPAGNLWGRYPAATGTAGKPIKRLVLGSHLDTVPNGGRYDGMLGVLAALAGVEQLAKAGIDLPFHVDIVGFGDEEGSRFGTTRLGSRAVAGSWQDDWWALTDAEGTTLREAFEQFGLKPERIAEAALSPEQLIGYLELHIEQGPVLEDRGLPLGVVTSIAGARRFSIELEGFAGHAGTVPMALRRDALAGAAELVLAVESVAKEEDVVATVGQLKALPGGVNVIPGAVQLSLDIRSAQDGQRDRALKRIRERLADIEQRRGLSSHWQETHKAGAVACSDWWQQLQSRVLAELDMEPLRLMSGAGHDAMAMAEVTDCAMYFMRCRGGVSHHPDESIEQADLKPTLAAMAQTILRLADDH